VFAPPPPSPGWGRSLAGRVSLTPSLVFSRSLKLLPGELESPTRVSSYTGPLQVTCLLPLSCRAGTAIWYPGHLWHLRPWAGGSRSMSRTGLARQMDRPFYYQKLCPMLLKRGLEDQALGMPLEREGTSERGTLGLDAQGPAQGDLQDKGSLSSPESTPPHTHTHSHTPGGPPTPRVHITT
jgi:hypothetical protein